MDTKTEIIVYPSCPVIRPDTRFPELHKKLFDTDYPEQPKIIRIDLNRLEAFRYQ